MNMPVPDSQKILSYEACRALIKNGDVLLYRGTGITSRLIKTISRSEYSHVGIAAWWNNRLMVLEAVGKGVVASALSENLRRYHGSVEYFWCRERITDEDRLDMLDFAQLQLGKEYNFLEVGWSGFCAALGVPVRNSDGSLKHAAGKYFCSQYVSDIFRAAGVGLAIDFSSARTPPGAIAQSPLLKFKGVLKRTA
jgi:hypothetical protein